MKTKKTGFALITIMLCLTAALSACSGNQNNEKRNETSNVETNNGTKGGNADGTKTENTQPVVENSEYPTLGKEELKFSFYVNYDWYAPVGYGNDPTTKWLKDTKKINIEEVSSGGNAQQKFGTMVAGDQYPDVIQLDRGSKEFNSLVENGKLVAIDDYLNKYPALKELLDPETLNSLRSPDGKIYGIPNWFNSTRNPNQTLGNGWLVNRKVYKELGQPKLETFDDLYAFLKQVKEKYPNMVPIDTGNVTDGNPMLVDYIYAGMGDNRNALPTSNVTGGGRVNLETSQVESLFDDPAYKETWKFLNLLFREKLLSQDTFTQKAEQFKEKINSGRIAIMAINDAAGNGKEANNILGDNGYDFLPLIHKTGVDASKVKNAGVGTLGWNLDVITTSAKSPERIFEFLDWWASKEGQRIMNFGPPGLLYDQVDTNGAPIDNEKAKTITDKEKQDLKLFNFRPLGSWYNTIIVNAKTAQDPSKETWDSKASKFYGQFVAKEINTDQFNSFQGMDPNSEAGVASQQIKQIALKEHTKLFYAKDDAAFEAEFSKYMDEVNKAGYDKVLAYQNKTWAENKKQLGIQ
ncbi:hypothetical protein [Paenibacillus glycanilyticus]|uniref:hypothetical protein n=1 Tax=Paenibacillus glycanilyticus TaxID=126569 RepID=UPI000FD80BD4|nr:hypothetical protein [Paenibacillus glycanilyticus]